MAVKNIRLVLEILNKGLINTEISFHFTRKRAVIGFQILFEFDTHLLKVLGRTSKEQA